MNTKTLAAAVACFGMIATSRAALADGSPRSTLFEGEYLFQGQRLVSDDCYYHLEMQGDGNLVVYGGYEGGTSLWATGTYQRCGGVWPFVSCAPAAAQYATLQGDGNFVVYWEAGFPAWASNTANAGKPGTAQLWMQDDANLVLYSDVGSTLSPVWASGTKGAVLGQTCSYETSVTHVEQNTNLAGEDYRDELTNDAMQCGSWCASSAWAPNGSHCNAFTWVPPGVQNASGVCWLKTGIPSSSSAPGMVSGYIRH
jgi:PAN domain